MFTFDDNEFESEKSEETAEETQKEKTQESTEDIIEQVIQKDVPYTEEETVEEEAENEEEYDDYSDLGIDEHEEYIIRMTKNERIQHLILFICVTMLVITGFALKIPFDIIADLKYGATLFKIRGYVHRFFGTSLLLATAYHFLHMAFTKEGRHYFKEMFPRIKDVTDGIHNIAFMLGFAKEPPKTEWFDYKEKIEYWALQAGTILIGTTGILLWTNRKWPTFVVNLSYLIHGMEAMLATGAIIIWHFYSIHFKPGQFPMNRTWIDGKMSLHHLKEEHRAVYDRYMSERRKAMKEGNVNNE